MKMLLLVEWLTVPYLVLGTCLASAWWFDQIWVIAFVGGMVALHVWTRATYRLVKSTPTLPEQRPGEHRGRHIFVWTLGTSTTLQLAALTVLIACPAARSSPGSLMVITFIAWCSLTKFGVVNVLLAHARRWQASHPQA